jgi:polyphosphate kinase
MGRGRVVRFAGFICRHLNVTGYANGNETNFRKFESTKIVPCHSMNSLDPAHFINRELSWLEFNQRVLEEALDTDNPLLERLKFFTIVSSNLDEFFEVRVAGLKQQIESGKVGRSVDGLTATEIFQALTRRIRKLVDDLYACWRADLKPALARQGIRLREFSELEPSDLIWIKEFYNREVRPVLTPLAIDSAHPFPQLLNKSLNLMVHLEMPKNGAPVKCLAVVQCPAILPRLVRLPRNDGNRDYVFLGQLIGHFLSDLFTGTVILGYWAFRVTRNSELYVDEEDTPNLLKAVEDELHKRRRGHAVRLEVARDCPEQIRETLLETLNLTGDDLYLIDGPLNPVRLMMLYQGDHSPELRDPPFLAPVAACLREKKDLFAAIRERDILLHHPYENFSSVIAFLETSATDPDVLAIKMTLYRTGGDQRIIGALMNAVNKGKQVTVVVELRARFDEANNIEWARKLEENGVHVVFGLVGYKIHAKCALVVRRENLQIRRYVHLGTGNYNPTTAKLYTDLSLLTSRSEFGEDATNLFNLLTGICQFQGMNKLVLAPFELHTKLLQLIAREAANAKRGLPARIIAKFNSLVEPELIEALYAASQSGVKIDLIIRGICCLRPGVPGLSENITVRSIVDRFLEHGRIYYFENALQSEVFAGSADWMPRNLFRRIEIMFPIADGRLCDRIVREILGITLADNTKARLLGPDGIYRRAKISAHEIRRRSQKEFTALTVPNIKNKTPGKYVQMKVSPRPLAKKRSAAG